MYEIRGLFGIARIRFKVIGNETTAKESKSSKKINVREIRTET